jgi:hypothetical protein
MPHRLPGHELFDLVAKLNSCQIRALFEGRHINLPHGGGYVDAYQRASTKCLHPNLLQPIVENRSRQPEQSLNAQSLIALMEGGMSMRTNVHPQNARSPITSSPSLRITVVNPLHQLNTPSSITLTEGGMLMRTNAHPLNAYSPISSSPSLRIAVVNPEHLWNAQSLIALTEGGNKISRSDLQSQNASVSITLSPS